MLEPAGARPVIIEDDCFIGSRAVVVEGAWLEEGVVVGANTVITASTPIIDVTGDEPVEYRGHVPARSVVVPGTRTKELPAGTYQLPCALIIGQRKASTDEKTVAQRRTARVRRGGLSTVGTDDQADVRDDLVDRLLEHCALMCVTGDEAADRRRRSRPGTPTGDR